MSRNGRLRDRQAETQSSKLTCDICAALSECIKNCQESFRGDPNTGICNLDQNLAPLVAGPYTDLATFRGEF